MANIRLKELVEANVDPKLVARSKETGKLVYFKNAQNKDAAMKAGTHEDPKAKKGDNPKADAKPNNMFGKDYNKDRGAKVAPKDDTDWISNLDSIDTSDVKGKADPNADSFTHDDVFGATFKDPQTGKTTTVGDAYEKEDNSPAYKKAFAYVGKFDPDKEAVVGTQSYSDLDTKAKSSSKLTSMLPKDAADGPKINGKDQKTPNRMFDKKKPFDPKEIEKDVTDMLKSDGYEVEHQWGTNDYFLNISKKDKKGKEIENYTVQKNPKTGLASVWDAKAYQWVVQGEPSINRLYDTIGQIPYFRED
jgi:hypothetical protein